MESFFCEFFSWCFRRLFPGLNFRLFWSKGGPLLQNSRKFSNFISIKLGINRKLSTWISRKKCSKISIMFELKFNWPLPRNEHIYSKTTIFRWFHFRFFLKTFFSSSPSQELSIGTHVLLKYTKKLNSKMEIFSTCMN